MPNFSGAAQGYLNFDQAQQQRQMQQAQLAQMLQAMSQRKQQFDQQQQLLQRQQAARAGAGQLFYDQMQPPPQPPAPGASSPPGTPNGGQPPPGGSAPGGGMVPPPPGAGGAGAPPAAASPSWQPMPAAPAGGGAPAPAGGMQQLPPPPADKPLEVGVIPGGGIDLKGVIQKAKAQGVPPDQLMDILDQMTPMMTAQNKQELQSYKMQIQLQKETIDFMHKRALELQGDKRLGLEEQRIKQGETRLDQGQQRIDKPRAAGGAGGGKKGPNMGNYNQFLAQEEKMLKPIEDAQRQTQEVRGLIASGSPASMTQVQKILSQYLQQGRMTNQMYGDNKSFGVVYERAANAISRFAQGDYSDKNKQIILDMMNKMDSTVFSPAREKIVKMNKERLKKMGGDETLAERPASFGGDDGARKPTFASKRQLEEAIAAKTVKKGDVFLDPDGNQHVVQ